MEGIRFVWLLERGEGKGEMAQGGTGRKRGSERDRDRHRQTDRQTDRMTEQESTSVKT